MDVRITRRHLTLLAGAAVAASAVAQTAQKPGTTIHQEIEFNATPARLYSVLLDSKQFAAATKDTADIQPQAGVEFQLFGGRISGRNVELITNRRIVQAWRPASWAPGVYSIVRFELVAQGEGTRVILDHAGFAEDKWSGLNAGWVTNYWKPLHAYLNA